MIDRDQFFDRVRADPFGGNLTQRQVDGLNTLLDVWEIHFRDADIRWLAYSLATAFHETAQTMEPIPEYGEGERTFLWRAVRPLRSVLLRPRLRPAHLGRELHQGRTDPRRQILRRMSDASVRPSDAGARAGGFGPLRRLHRGLVYREWGCPEFFNDSREDPYEARTVVNGHDKAELIESYYYDFKKALQ